MCRCVKSFVYANASFVHNPYKTHQKPLGVQVIVSTNKLWEERPMIAIKMTQIPICKCFKTWPGVKQV